ncbi:pyridoxal phosphate-dependent aminotransferase family protein [Clostridium bornimense]|uniref:aminotransferase class I/II-fold pyridoxal phosphate-dependent enzyme n=1 Tax=Clostridium bornimense TaxID=1216932 RepID=UPI001C0F47C8|nr:pyridoxal phosphate-dependent aminotransferase family protein [Clostridium bornimense]MBU5316396.1 pyridoxal phosphate-dependent aminotransferase family protein [Clostridium bornimense]
MLKTAKMPNGFKNEYDKVLPRIRQGKAQDLYVFEPAFDGPQAGTSKYDGKDVIMLTSNNYLGLSTHPEIIKAIKKAVDKYGTGTCGARLHNGTTVLHKQLEEKIAEYFRTESAMIVSAGYLANVSALSTLCNDSDSVIITDQLNHMSIVDGIAMSNAKVKIFSHNNMEKLEYILQKSQEFQRKLIVVDGVYSMDGDIACLDEIVELAEKYDAAVMVDEAHSIGFFGETGRGTSEHFKLEDKVAIKMATFSKSLAGVGGCIASDKDTIDYLKHQAHQYIFNASLPPAVVAGVLKSFEIMEKETWRREKLWDNTIRFRKGLKELGFNTMNSISPIIPIYIGDDNTNMHMTKELLNRGVYIATAIFPSVPMNKSRLRTTITASLSSEEIDRALDIMGEVGRRFGVI